VKLLANPLSQQAGKWLVIRRRPESSAVIQYAVGFVRYAESLFLLDSGLRRNDGN
jgi:hypothetical protein